MHVVCDFVTDLCLLAWPKYGCVCSDLYIYSGLDLLASP